MAPFQDVPCTIKQGSALLNMMGFEEALNVVVERGGVVENVVIATMFFLFFL